MTSICVAVPAVASAEVVVVGTGNPLIDVPAVQTAVDGGGVVKLQGHFSFDVPPTDDRTILVTRGVVVSGVPDEEARIPTIVGGKIAFRVDAPGAPVVFEHLRFVGARSGAIEVRAASNVAIDRCKVEGVLPLFSPAVGVSAAYAFLIGLSSGPVVGDITISNNELEIGGTVADRTEGIIVIRVGSAQNPASVRVFGNVVRSITADGIDVRNVVGPVSIERNTVITGSVGGQQVPLADRFVNGIRIMGTGAYRVVHNLVEVGFENAAGIRLLGTPTTAIVDAVVESNDIVMVPSEGAVAGTESAGIEVRRAAVGNVLLHNRIWGRARAALALIAEGGRIPQDTLLVGNNVSTAISSAADMLISPGVIGTTVIGGHGTLDDQGIGTVVKGDYK
jgi:hypothetical protein